MTRPYSNTPCNLVAIAEANSTSVTVLTEVLEELEARCAAVRALLETAREQEDDEWFEWPSTDIPTVTKSFW